MWWYLAAILAFLALMAIALAVDLRTSPEEEARRLKRQDESAAKVKDDTNEPARWVP
jgi:TRAP-type C4-dicarboxylate transport system permease small subunit